MKLKDTKITDSILWLFIRKFNCQVSLLSCFEVFKWNQSGFLPSHFGDGCSAFIPSTSLAGYYFSQESLCYFAHWHEPMSFWTFSIPPHLYAVVDEHVAVLTASIMECQGNRGVHQDPCNPFVEPLYQFNMSLTVIFLQLPPACSPYRLTTACSGIGQGWSPELHVGLPCA